MCIRDSPCIFVQAICSPCSWNRNNIGALRHHPGKRNLGRCRLLFFCYLVQQSQKRSIFFHSFFRKLRHHTAIIRTRFKNRIFIISCRKETIRQRRECYKTNVPVSYTHLDVYKRQQQGIWHQKQKCYRHQTVNCHFYSYFPCCMAAFSSGSPFNMFSHKRCLIFIPSENALPTLSPNR